MPDTHAVHAHALMENLVRAIEQLTIPHGSSGAAPVLTVSIGGATLREGGAESAAALLDAVDHQLYRAKHGGRNRVEWRVAD